MFLSLRVAGQNNAPEVKLLRSERLENLFSIDRKVFSGSSPRDQQGFQELKALGIKTIISVDGGKPDAETARKYGMRYIHIPIGYDGTTCRTPTGLVDAMVEIDLRWDHLKAVQKAGYKIPPDHPDLVPEKEAVLLMQVYRELARAKEAQDLGADFIDRLKKAEGQAAALHSLLRSGQPLKHEQADALWTMPVRHAAVVTRSIGTEAVFVGKTASAVVERRFVC